MWHSYLRKHSQQKSSTANNPFENLLEFVNCNDKSCCFSIQNFQWPTNWFPPEEIDCKKNDYQRCCFRICCLKKKCCNPFPYSKHYSIQIWFENSELCLWNA